MLCSWHVHTHTISKYNTEGVCAWCWIMAMYKETCPMQCKESLLPPLPTSAASLAWICWIKWRRQWMHEELASINLRHDTHLITHQKTVGNSTCDHNICRFNLQRSWCGARCSHEKVNATWQYMGVAASTLMSGVLHENKIWQDHTISTFLFEQKFIQTEIKS